MKTFNYPYEYHRAFTLFEGLSKDGILFWLAESKIGRETLASVQIKLDGKRKKD